MPRGRKPIHPVVEFEGVRYYLKPAGYRKSDDGVYLHRAVWAHHNGPIPAGWHVHHINGDKSDNAGGNLVALPQSEHASHHMAERPAGWWKTPLAQARAAAEAWHRDPAFRPVRVEGGKKSWVGREPVRLLCTGCGAGYAGFWTGRGAKFCAPKCRSKHRRDSGVDNETRQCRTCGVDFRVSRYSKQQHCGASCGGTAAAATRAHPGVRPDSE